MATTDKAAFQAADAAAIFRHILVGVDGTEPGYEACRQARRLADVDATIEALAVVHLADTVYLGFDAAHHADELEFDAQRHLAHALQILGPQASTRFVNGFVTATILKEAEQEGATLVALPRTATGA